jgi:hypothetical protein
VVRRSTTQVRAREQARARLAQRHAATRAREKANEDDLIAFLALDADGAAVTRDAAITAARTAYDTAIAAIHTAQAEKVSAMLARGESAADVADLTGWTLKQVRASTTPTPTTTRSTTPSDAAGDTTATGEQAS